MIRITTNRNAFVFLAVFLLMLLAAREAFSADLPALQTLSAQKQVAGTADAGTSFTVREISSLGEGEDFALVSTPNGDLWIRLEAGMNARVSDTITLTQPTYLFRQPVVEESSPQVNDLGVGDYALTSRQGLNPKAIGVNQACTNFIRPNGSFGAWGSYLMGKISRGSHPAFFNEGLGDLGRVCPKFKSMNDEEKKNFWVWLIASMANFESSCNPGAKAKGVNGTAAGLLQLHLGKEHLYGCAKGTNSLNAISNLGCGLTMLNNDLRRTGKIFPGRGNYWEVLRPQTAAGGRTLRVVKKYGPCF